MDQNGEPLIRVMALHALAYCERLFYLEEVEEIRLADASVYAGRTLHENLEKAQEENGTWSILEMASEKLGLIGKVDCLKRIDGSVIPYEHKRGKPHREGKILKAWPSDALQVSAYAMLLEEHSGHSVPEGRVRYHQENVTVRVPLDQAARASVLNAVKRANDLRNTNKRPPVVANDRVCVRCSLAPVCLPEEERLVNNPEWEPLRLFPASNDLKTIHIVEPGARIGRSGNTLKIDSPDGKQTTILIGEVQSLVIHGYPQITTQAIHLCADSEISVHFVSGAGRYVAGVTPGAGPVQRRLRQFAALSDPVACLNLARKIVMAKIEAGLRYILRTTRGRDRESLGLTDHLKTIRECIVQSARANGTDELRGYEGLAGRAYFAAIPALLRDEVPSELRFTKRSRRPPKDRFNALLGFGYSLLYSAVLRAVVAVGLDPAIGLFHTPRSAAHPLVLDLMELFRLSLWDIPLLGSVNRLQWNPVEDFSVTPGRVWLSDIGRKKAIEIFEKRLEEKWKHPVTQYSLSYARLIELEVRLLEKEWTGQPGLFARMRLR